MLKPYILQLKHWKVLQKIGHYVLHIKCKLCWVDFEISIRMELSEIELESFGSQTIPLCYIEVSCLAREIIFSPSVHFSWHHSVGNPKNRNARFNRSVFHIYVNEVSFCTKSIKLYNFVIHFFPLSHTVFKIRKLTPQFSTRWRCERSYSVAHIQFTRHRAYKNSKSRPKLRGWQGTLVDIMYNHNKITF